MTVKTKERAKKKMEKNFVNAKEVQKVTCVTSSKLVKKVANTKNVKKRKENALLIRAKQSANVQRIESWLMDWVIAKVTNQLCFKVPTFKVLNPYYLEPSTGFVKEKKSKLNSNFQLLI